VRRVRLGNEVENGWTGVRLRIEGQELVQSVGYWEGEWYILLLGDGCCLHCVWLDCGHEGGWGRAVMVDSICRWGTGN